MASALALFTGSAIPLAGIERLLQPAALDVDQCSQEFVQACERHERPGEPAAERCLRTARLLDLSGNWSGSAFSRELDEVLRKAVVVAELAVEEHLRRLAISREVVDPAMQSLGPDERGRAHEA